jgi:putative transposase
MVNTIWKEVPYKFENVKLDKYQVMPNHFHGIIIIDSMPGKNFKNLPHLQAVEIPAKQTGKTLAFKPVIQNNPMELNRASLGRIIRWFKGRVKFEANKIISDFKWQPRYFDRIIRDDKEFYFIVEYIENNPANWDNNILKKYFQNEKK